MSRGGDGPPGSRFPHPLPAGWFMIAHSDGVAPGEVRPERIFDREWALFRTESGRVALIDAFCPHLGAHLGHGGRVEGEMLECPFHGWRFETSGTCSAIPYAKRKPSGGEVRVCEIVEHGGRVWAWFASDERAPSFAVPTIAEEIDAAWEELERRDWKIHSCLQELSENGADSAHFRFVHDMPEIPEMNPRFEGPHVVSRIETAFPTRPGEKVPVQIDVTSLGMGCDVMRYSGGIELLEVVSKTPIDAETVRVDVSFRMPRSSSQAQEEVLRDLAEWLIWQFSKDIPIWENKLYRETPALCDGDGPITEFRRWCRQFYPD
ncbi:MAG: (2Fe-2S)-binding protein [Deltaproteobacteria bacterium]|nr:(2Fe-2S)-binding protein [Deltaproteobacteria bacterium]